MENDEDFELIYGVTTLTRTRDGLYISMTGAGGGDFDPATDPQTGYVFGRGDGGHVQAQSGFGGGGGAGGVFMKAVSNDEEEPDPMSRKLEALRLAESIVEPIVEKHGLKEYKGGAPVLYQASTFTVVDQHIDHILHVADWLLGNDR